MSPVSTFEKQKFIKMLRMPTFGDPIPRIIFPVSTAIDKYKESKKYKFCVIYDI